jgi:hypothetical protein
MEMMDFMQGNASPLGQQLLMTVPPGGRRIARREFTLSDESREPGIGNRESGIGPCLKYHANIASQVLRSIWDASSGTRYLGRGIWDASSGTLSLFFCLSPSAFGLWQTTLPRPIKQTAEVPVAGHNSMLKRRRTKNYALKQLAKAKKAAKKARNQAKKK